MKRFTSRAFSEEVLSTLKKKVTEVNTVFVEESEICFPETCDESNISYFYDDDFVNFCDYY